MVSFLVWLAVTAVTFYIALVYGSVALGLLGFAELVLFLLALVYLLVYRRKISASIRIPIAVADKGKKVRIQMEVENRAYLPCTKIRYRIRYGNAMAGKRPLKWFAGEAVPYGTHTYEDRIVPEYAGNYLFDLVKIRIYDMTGLFYIDKKLNKSTGVQVLPELNGIEVQVSERVRNYFGESDDYDDFHAGDDSSQIFDVREFRPGDRLQKIHWKLSAKSEELLVREDSQPLACAVVFLLEAQKAEEKTKKVHRPECRRHWRARAEQMEKFLTVAADISCSMMEAACPHYMAWYSDSRKDVVRLRVDDEESLYLFLNCYMQDCAKPAPMPLAQMYEEKYRHDVLLYRMELTPAAALMVNGQELAQFGGRDWKEKLTGMEILL